MNFRVVAAFGLSIASVWASAETISLAPVGGDAKTEVSSADVVKVRGKGIGTTRDEALKDAYRDAVERAVGLFVDAEQMVKNDELIKDEILTQSNAYIKKCDVIKESKENGLAKVVILATVHKAEIVKKVSGTMPGVTLRVEDALKDIHAEMASKETRNTDAAALLKHALEYVDPVRQLMRLSLASTQPQVAKEFAAMDEPPAKGTVRLGYLFKMELDRDRYFRDFLPKLKQVLDQISIKKPRTVRLVDAGESNEWYPKHVREKYVNAGSEFLQVVAGRESNDILGVFEHPWFFVWRIAQQTIGIKAEEEMSACGNGDLCDINWVNVCTGVPDNAATTGEADFQDGLSVLLLSELNNSGAKALLYVVDQKTALVIRDWQKSFVGSRHGATSKRLVCDIVFKGADGSEVAAYQWGIAEGKYCKSGYRTLQNTGFLSFKADGQTPSTTWVVSPFVRVCGERYLEWRSFDLNKDDLARISSVSIELSE